MSILPNEIPLIFFIILFFVFALSKFVDTAVNLFLKNVGIDPRVHSGLQFPHVNKQNLNVSCYTQCIGHDPVYPYGKKPSNKYCLCGASSL